MLEDQVLAESHERRFEDVRERRKIWRDAAGFDTVDCVAVSMVFRGEGVAIIDHLLPTANFPVVVFPRAPADGT